MGLQHYELQLLTKLRAQADSEWAFSTRSVGSMRGLGADVRVPMRVLARASVARARMVGRFAYRGAEVVHRLDLRLPPASVPEVITVHDLPPLHFPDEGKISQWAVETARAARLIICPSHFAAGEVEASLGVTRTAVAYNGVAETMRSASPLTEDELRVRGLPEAFVLHAGGATMRKNLHGLAGAWRVAAKALPDVSLVLVGPPDARRDEAFAGLPRVVKPGYLAQPDLARLMASALLIVIPSVYEGFGLPAIEAMTVGCPVLAVRAGALPEICGDAATLVESDFESIAEGILCLADSPSRRKRMATRGLEHSSGFTWDRAAAGHVAAYREAFL